MFALVVHGGAGVWPAERQDDALAGVAAAVEAGMGLLRGGGTALDAVTAAVTLLEDDPVFNAGTGSVLCLDGEVEMDAGVMVGDDLRCGGVACLKRVRNPVQVARKVMEVTDHVLLAGEGAFLFARALGFTDHDPITAQRREQWAHLRRALLAGQDADRARLRALLNVYPDLAGGTVGAVAVDGGGSIAAATSTGGVALQLPGRIGDTPIPGAGNYASGWAGASATGTGELMLRLQTAKSVCDRVASGQTVEQAVHGAVGELTDRFGPLAGLVALDRSGAIGIAHATPTMPHAYASERQPRVRAAMRLG